jgi:phage replication O-like protein O
MADVQLEHGHVRIANRLAEAMLDAEFSGSQFKMLHGLIRLTYGWRRRTVTLSHAELAAYLHTTPSGTFRAALRELVTEGVVLQLEQGVGHKKSTLAIQKDFTRWGKFSVAPERLERMFGGRPESADELIDASSPPTPASETGEEPGAPPVVPDPTPAESVPAGPPAQRQAYGLPENRQAVLAGEPAPDRARFAHELLAREPPHALAGSGDRAREQLLVVPQRVSHRTLACAARSIGDRAQLLEGRPRRRIAAHAPRAPPRGARRASSSRLWTASAFVS